MDAKSKATFINSVSEKKGIPCSKCNTLNKIDALFCEKCGESYEKLNKKDNLSLEEIDEKSIFAEGLPSWNIEPPQVLVRRKKK